MSCSPQKRLNRIVKNNPHILQKDTIQIVVRDTIIIQSQTYDTITKFFHSDTIQVIDNSRITLKYYYDTIEKNIYHSVDYKTDTIFFEKIVPVEVERVVIKELTWWQKNNQWIIFLGIIFILSLIYQKIKKNFTL
tara:strand:+ start:3077 stop:3481 length:405 start_codon:yes stop_codon:yes gene_type:complete